VPVVVYPRTPGLRALGAALLLLAGCELPGKPKPDDRYVPPQDVRSFAALYRQNCAGCHGADGTLGAAPPLDDQLFRALVPDAVLQSVVAGGRPGTLMPAFAIAQGGTLTAEQVHILAAGIKTHWGPAPPAPPDAPPYLAAQQPTGRADGAAAFARACATCHGTHGQGGKSAGAINDPVFLALISDQALRRIIITGRPDLGMPDYASPAGRPAGFAPLTAAEVTALVELLAGWRQGSPPHTIGD
jgi:mono/diheme cytochrome c family protein